LGGSEPAWDSGLGAVAEPVGGGQASDLSGVRSSRPGGTQRDVVATHFPCRSFAINQDRLSVGMLAVDLVAWTGVAPALGDLAKTEPKTLRYRPPHVAVCLPRPTPALAACPTH
jgi:hypothetical protein